jgi:hypothetical protein
MRDIPPERVLSAAQQALAAASPRQQPAGPA